MPLHAAGSRTDRAPHRAGAMAIVLLVATSCASDSAPVFVDDLVEEAPQPATTAVVVPATTESPPPLLDPIEVTRAWSPANATAEIIGTGAVATDVVTVDDRPAAPESFDVDGSGGFTLRVRIEDEGAHTVCVRDVCSRVFTLAPDAESSAEVEAKIDQALPLAKEIFDGEALFPDWSIVVSGPFSGTGGSTDDTSKTITIYANRDRSVEEYVTTILHEWGHVVDAERLDDEERDRYRAARGIDPATPWRSIGRHTLEEWGSQPSEDFAEVLVALWTAESASPHQVRTLAPNGQPDTATFDVVTAIVAG